MMESLSLFFSCFSGQKRLLTCVWTCLFPTFSLFLTVTRFLSVSLENPDADPQTEDEVILKCSLSTYSDLPACESSSLHWLDSEGTVLLGKGVGYEFLRQTKCFIYLKVQRQSGHNRKYTCQLENKEDGVKIQADYTPKFTRGKQDCHLQKWSCHNQVHCLLAS